jgi:hypothetical protein
MVRADQNPTLKFYLMAQNYVTSPPAHIVNYCVGGSTSSVYNVYERDGNGWLKVPYPFTPMGPWQSVQTQPCSAQ